MIIRFFITGRKSYMGHYLKKTVIMCKSISGKKKTVHHNEHCFQSSRVKVVELRMNVINKVLLLKVNLQLPFNNVETFTSAISG